MSYCQILDVIKRMPLEIKEEIQKEIKKDLKQSKPKRTLRKKNIEIVAYTIDGIGLTKEEYTNQIMQASNDAHAGIGLISHEEAMFQIDQKIKEYENKMTK